MILYHHNLARSSNTKWTIFNGSSCMALCTSNWSNGEYLAERDVKVLYLWLLECDSWMSSIGIQILLSSPRWFVCTVKFKKQTWLPTRISGYPLKSTDTWGPPLKSVSTCPEQTSGISVFFLNLPRNSQVWEASAWCIFCSDEENGAQSGEVTHADHWQITTQLPWLPGQSSLHQ